MRGVQPASETSASHPPGGRDRDRRGPRLRAGEPDDPLRRLPPPDAPGHPPDGLADHQARPRAGPPTIGVDGEVEILRGLLAVERDRLAVAREIEKKRDIVFPETTVIIRDIERLLGKVRVKEDADVSLAAPVLIAQPERETAPRFMRARKRARGG